MTFKEIAEVAGCSDRTARKYARKTWPNRNFTGTLGARLSEADSRMLMDQLPKRNMVESGKSGKSSAEKVPVSQVATVPSDMEKFVDRRLDRLESVVERLIGAIATITGAVQNQQPQQKSLPFIPEIPVRKQIANVVNEWVMKRTNGQRDQMAFANAFQRLYKDFGDRYGIDVVKRAENRGIKPIEYLEREGKLEELYLVAITIFMKGSA